MLKDSEYGDNTGRWVDKNTFACPWPHGNWGTDALESMTGIGLAKMANGTWHAKFDEDGAHTACTYSGDWNNDAEVLSWKPNGLERWL